MSLLQKFLQVTMPDGTVWMVPVEVVARHRAAAYASDFGGDVERSLAEDTWPLFNEVDFEVTDWSANNMDWVDVSAAAVKVADPKLLDAAGRASEWCNAPKQVVNVVPPAVGDPLTIPGPVDKEAFLALAEKAYGWSVYTSGDVAGLVASDMGYDGCNTKWGDLMSSALGSAPSDLQESIHEKLAELAELCQQALKT